MATETTVNSAKAWSPDVQGFAPGDAVPDALILSTSTVSGHVEGDEPALRVPWVDDADAQFTAEGAEIPEADPVLAETTVYTGKVTQLVRISREQWVQDRAAGLLSESVRRAVTKRANQAYIAQPAPTAPAVTPPAGLRNIAGILTGFGTIDEDLDELVDAITEIETNGGVATNIIASPSAWGSLRKVKTADGDATTLLGAGTNDTEKRLLGIPVITSNAVPPGEMLVVDKRAIVSAVGSVLVAVSQDFFFSSDSIALRCTWRFGQNVVHSDRLARLTVAGDAS